MDLHKQLENTERSWNKEKMELLERFDNERKEWECQWKVMQKKIEELYQEVKLRRESNLSARDNKAIQNKVLQLSVRSPASEESDTVELNHQHTVENDRMETEGSLLSKTGQGCKETRGKSRNNTLPMDSLAFENQEEPEDSLGTNTSKKNAKNYIGDLNVALKELARVSEELCSYQEEIRKKSNHRRMKSLPFLREFEEAQKAVILPEMNHVSSSGSQTSVAFETEEHNNRKNLLSSTKALQDISYGSLTGDFTPWQKKEAPPVPPRSTSRHLTNSLSAVVQLSEAPRGEPGTRSSCQAGGCWRGRRLLNPSPPHQQGACAEEGRDAKGPVMVTAPTPVSKAQCHGPTSFCHNTWAFDAGKLGKDNQSGASPLSAQKSCSDGSTAQGTEEHQEQNPGSPSGPDGGKDWSAPAAPRSPAGEGPGWALGKPQRNETLAAKTDEFNRAVFRTGKRREAPLERRVPGTGPGGGRACDPAAGGRDAASPPCLSDTKPSAGKEKASGNPSEAPGAAGPPKQTNGLPSGGSGCGRRPQEREWSPGDLSGRPRSADARSNYGVVEKLLRNYGKPRVSAPGPAKCCKEQWAGAHREFGETRGQNSEVPRTEQGKQEFARNSARRDGQQPKQGRERQKLPEVPLPGKGPSGKGFSRPARPANRRLPSRWASRSPSAPPAVRGTAYGCSGSFRSQPSAV